MEVITPFEESLSLFPDHSFSNGMAMRAHSCGFYLGFLNGFMWCFSSIRPSNLTVRGQMAAGAGDSKVFFTLRTRFGALDLGLVQIGKIKRFRIMAHIAGLASRLYVTSVHGPGIGSSKRVC